MTCVGQGSATITVTGTATRNAALLSRASDTVNGESFTSTYDLTVRDAVEAAETREITVAVGATAADTIADANYAGSYTTGDESIATVTVTGTDGSESTTNYGEAHVTYNDLLGRNSTRASTGYYVKVGESYYPLYATGPAVVYFQSPIPILGITPQTTEVALRNMETRRELRILSILPASRFTGRPALRLSRLPPP